jgi:glycerol-3-phosphate dehydrogenase subunit B
VKAVVLGGGLAGATAALQLAAGGAEVTLVRRGPGATALSWGSLDVAGASPDPTGLPWRDPVSGEPLAPAQRLSFLLHSRPFHPLAALFPERDAARAVRAVKEAARVLDGWLRPQGVRVEGSLDETRLLANVRGAVRAADLAFDDVAAGDLARATAVLFVDLPGLPGWNAAAAARAVGAELEALGVPAPPLHVAPLALSAGLQADVSRPARLAARLDDPAAQDALVEGAVGLAADGRTTLFPPVLGLFRGTRLRAALREALGGPVAEVQGAPPWSPSGARLDRALLGALHDAGVRVVQGEARGVVGADGRITGVDLRVARGAAGGGAGEPVSLASDAVVLATGRFSGGGLAERGDRLVEPLLGLPLYDDRGRRVDGVPARRHLRRRYADPQPLFSAGIRTDGRARPLGAAGRVAYANLVAAGEVIGGFDPALQRTGLGFALLSGLRAAEEAARVGVAS